MGRLGLNKSSSAIPWGFKTPGVETTNPAGWWRAAAIFAIALIIVSGIVYLIRKPTGTEAAWFHSQWHYRKAITIDNGGSAVLTDHQIILSDYNTAADITAGKMQADCNDIRFTNNEGVILNYWIESGCNTSTTDIWVKVDSVNVGSNATTIYMYYGNPNAEPYSDGNNTFEFFDNFEGSALDTGKWTNDNSANISFSNGIATITESSDDNNKNIYATSYNATGSIIFEARVDATTTPGSEYLGLVMKADNNSNTNKYKIGYGSVTTQLSFWYLNAESWTESTGTRATVSDTYHILGIVYNGSAYQGFVDRSQIQSNMTNQTFTKHVPAIAAGLENGVANWDWVLARKYSATQPTFDTPSSEDNSGAGPVAYYNFDEGQGSIAYNKYSAADTGPAPILSFKMDDNVSGNNQTIADDSGNANNGITKYGANASGMTCTVAGKIGSYACDFDGTDDYIDITDDGDQDLQAQDFSIETWFALDSLPTAGNLKVIYNNGIDANNGIGIGYMNHNDDSYDGMTMQIMNNGVGYNVNVLPADFSPTLGSWYHIAYIRDYSANKIYVYINGKQYNTRIGIGVWGVTGDNGPVIGARYNGSSFFWDGKIDHFKIYDYMRTPAQISADYKNTHGYITGADWTEDGVKGKALSFDGIDDFLAINNPSNLDSTGDVSISAWVRSTAVNITSTRQSIVAMGDGNDYTNNYQLFIDDDGFFTIGEGSYATYASKADVLSANEWYHLIGTFDGTTARFYINGTQQGSDIFSGSRQTGGSLHIGRRLSQWYFKGFIDEVKIWDRAISLSEIQAEYNLGAGVKYGVELGQQSDKYEGLVGWWKMDENSWSGVSGEVVDSSGNGNNGTAINSLTTSAGKYGKAGNFNGSSHSISVNDNHGLNITEAITIEAWIYPTIDQQASIITRAYQTNYRGYEFGIRNYDLIFRYNANGSSYNYAESTGNFISLNQWQHVAVTYDEKIIKYYVNGRPVYSYSISGDLISSGESIRIGSYVSGNDYLFPGKMDDLKIYNKARTAQQIMQDYLEGAEPIGWWKLDEGSGVLAYDYSGNDNHGTLNNMEEKNWLPAKNNKGLNFDGSSDYIEVGDKDIYDFGINDFSFSGWVKTTQTDSGYWVAKRDSAAGFEIAHTNGIISWYIRDGSGNVAYDSVEDGTKVNDGAWHFVALVFNRGNNKIQRYVDGIATGTEQTFGTVGDISNMVSFGIGARIKAIPDNYFAGQLDDIKMYNFALSSWQIAQEYSGGAPIVHYKFDEGRGDVAYNTADEVDGGAPPIAHWSLDQADEYTGKARDLIANNHGTITGATYTTDQTGRTNKAMDFNGLDNYIITSGPSFDEADKISLEFWTYITGGSGDYIIELPEGSSGQNGIGIRYDGGNIYYHVLTHSDSSTTDVVSAVSLSTWYHIALVYDGITLYGYKNGTLVGSHAVTLGSGIKHAAGEINIGRFGTWGGNFDGNISSVKIYDYARSAGQIYTDYNKTAGYIIGPSWEDNGKFGKALSFDGTNDYINLGASSKFNFSTTDFTLAGWIKTQQATEGAIFRSSQNAPYVIFGINGGKLRATLHDGTNSANDENSNGPTINDNQWHHIAVVFDRDANLIFYKDGVAAPGVSISTITGSIGNPIPYAALGKRPNTETQFFKGLMDEFKVYNYARSPYEILNDYNQGYVVKLGVQENQNADGLIGHWQMDEVSGLIAGDSSGNGNDLSLTSTSFTVGKYANALNLSGTGNYGQTASLKPVTSSNNNFTVSAWMKFNSYVDYSYILDSCSGSSYQGFSISTYSTTNNFRFWVRTTDGKNYSTSQYTGYSIPLNQWIYVTLSFNNETGLRFYVDGELKTTITSYTTVSYAAEQDFIIGKPTNSSSYYFDGYVDDVKIYNNVRTGEQIMRDYMEGPPAIAHWSFDDYQGSVAKDESNNGNDGTLTNGPKWVPGKKGSALKFDGSNDRVIASDLGLPSGNSDRSVSLWFKTDDTPDDWDNLFTYGTMSSSNAFSVQFDNYSPGKKIIIGKYGANALSANNTVIADNEWNNIIVTYENTGAIKYYLNGILDGSTTLSGVNTILDSSIIGSHFIGWPPSGEFKGLLDDVKVYNYVLSDYQIAQEFDGGKPVLYLPFDEGQGQTAYDKSIHQYNGILGATTAVSTDDPVWTVAGKYNSALSFDGGDYIKSGDVDFADGPFSVSYWAKTGTSGEMYIVSKQDAGAYDGYRFGFSNGNYRIRLSDGTNAHEYSGSTNYADNLWHHFEFSYDTYYVSVYVDGKYITKHDFSDVNTINPDQVLVIGASYSGNSQWFTGYIDDVRIYNYARSPQQVLQDYNGGFGFFVK